MLGAGSGLVAGDTFEVSGVTGGTGASLVNGEQTAAQGSTGTTLTFLAAAGLSFTYGSGGTIATGGILPVRVLDVLVGNSMTVNYNSVTGFATWNRSGTIAVILI